MKIWLGVGLVVLPFLLIFFFMAREFGREFLIPVAGGLLLALSCAVGAGLIVGAI